GNHWLSWRAWGSRGWRCCDFLWAFRSDGAMPAHVITVIGLQFAENNRGQNGKPAERDKRLVHSLNHLRRVRGKPIRDKERCNYRGRCNAEADRHLLSSAGDGARHARVAFRDVGVYERIYTRVLQGRKESEAEGLEHNEPHRGTWSDGGEQRENEANDHGVVVEHSTLAKAGENDRHRHF